MYIKIVVRGQHFHFELCLKIVVLNTASRTSILLVYFELNNQRSNIDTSMNVGMANVYFRVNLFFVRMAGVPLKVQKVSLLSSVYNEILAMCYYCTYLSVTLDCVFKQQELHESMKNVRMIFGMAVVAMMHLYLRYRNYTMYIIYPCTNIYLHTSMTHHASHSFGNH
jgi:hypothetical protein